MTDERIPIRFDFSDEDGLIVKGFFFLDEKDFERLNTEKITISEFLTKEEDGYEITMEYHITRTKS